MKFRRLMSGVMAAAGVLTLGAAVAPATAQAATGCTPGRVCVWSDAEYQGVPGSYTRGVPKLPASLDRKISSVKAVQDVARWVFYAEQNYVHPVFCIGASPETDVHNLDIFRHNDQFRSMKPSNDPCPA